MQKNNFACIFLLLLSGTCFSQSGILHTILDKDSILIGEPVFLKVSMDKNMDSTKFKWDSAATYPKIELVKINGVITINNENFFVYTITSFDTGKIVVPSLILVPNTKTKPVVFFVKPIQIDSLSAYKDIKPISEAEPTSTDYSPYFIGSGIVLLMVLLFFYFRKKLQGKPHKPGGKQNAYEIAMKKLAVLENGLGPEIPYKLLFHSLDGILKEYMWQKAWIQNDRLTNGELQLILSKELNDKEVLLAQIQMLQLSNFVQYAKFIPNPELCKEAIANYKRTVTTIENNNHVL